MVQGLLKFRVPLEVAGGKDKRREEANSFLKKLLERIGKRPKDTKPARTAEARGGGTRHLVSAPFRVNHLAVE